MGTVEAREFANAYQKKISARGRTMERVAAEAAYSASVVETAHPNRRNGGPYLRENLENAKQDCICELKTFLGNKVYNHPYEKERHAVLFSCLRATKSTFISRLTKFYFFRHILRSSCAFCYAFHPYKIGLLVARLRC